ncbi:hypothetical protein [Acinetobacter rathckeae]|uniref:hypothetical protein n=1 Tax=Acinetobacter rathckeae TaxID=2605272 RepID=UPI0018A2CF0F|nr:hypothetical protein [Acinetobacter rathckeae]MBF7687051.1 hypothetical protein [Acinetobacter rathckeae]
MNVSELRAFYRVKNNSQLARKIGRGRTTICDWDKFGIPNGAQAILQIQTNGALKADLKQQVA